MSDVKRKIIYSTDPSFVDHEKIKNLQEAEELYVARNKETSIEELRPLSKGVIDDNENLPPLITLENFMYYWYDKIVAYVEEGRDLVAEKNPNNSIFLNWGKEHIRISQGYRVGVSRGSKVTVEEETNRKKYNFEVLVTTPGLGLDTTIGVDAFQALDMEHIAINIVKIPLDTVREQEMAAFTTDLSRIHDEELRRSNILEQREEFKNAWRKALKEIKEYYEEYKKNGNYLPTQEEKEMLKNNKLGINKNTTTVSKVNTNDDDDVEWDY